MSEAASGGAISRQTLRRFILGRQGLWPGRRWAGEAGLIEALLACEAIQMDPLNVVARSHDIALWGRVADYQPAMLDRALYERREFFDYGGGLFIYPMRELPYWRTPMRRRAQEAGRWATFAAEHPDLLDEVRAELRARGPLGNRDFSGRERVKNYRGGKDSAVALYYLWLTGEVMIHHRVGFERVYDLRERIAPAALDYAAPAEEAEAYFARKTLAFHGLTPERALGAGQQFFIGWTDRAETRARRERLAAQPFGVPLSVEGSRERWIALSDDLPLLDTLAAGEIPTAWAPLGATTTEEVVFLAPLDIVSARGRALQLFDFEYIWEVYKPAAARRWGYYTLPILYGDTLVARLDPRLDRPSKTLRIEGFWREPNAIVDDAAFAEALARGLARFACFLGAERIALAAYDPANQRAQVERRANTALATLASGASSA